MGLSFHIEPGNSYQSNLLCCLALYVVIPTSGKQLLEYVKDY